MLRPQRPIFLSLLIMFLLASCADQDVKKTDVQQPHVKITGINSQQLSTDYFENEPYPNYFYGQLNFSTTLNKNIVKGPEAKSLIDWVISIFGKEVKDFGITVTPVVDNVELATVVLISYQYDSEKNTWKSDYVSEHITPFVRVNGNTKFGYRFSFVSSKTGELPLATTISNAIQSIAGTSPGSWAISELSKDSLEKSSKTVDLIISQFMSQTVKSKVTGLLRPGFNKERQKVYAMLDNGNKHLAKVSVTVELSSLVGSTQKHDTSGLWSTSIPKVGPYEKPKNTIYTSGLNAKTIGSYLYEKGFLNDLRAIKDAPSFRAKCNSLFDEIQTQVGLNVFDTIRVVRNVLKDDTNYQYNSELYNSGCIDSTWKGLLDKMGAPLLFERGKAASFSEDKYTELALYSMDPDHYTKYENTIRELYDKRVNIRFNDEFSKSILYGTSPYSPEEPPVEETLSKFINILSGLETARFCCYKNPKTGRPLKDGTVNSVEMILRKRGESQLVSMRSYRGTKDQYHYVEFEAIDNNHITKSELNNMLQPRVEYNEVFNQKDNKFLISKEM